MTNKIRIIIVAVFLLSITSGIIMFLTSYSHKRGTEHRFSFGNKIGLITVEGVIKDSDLIVKQLKGMRLNKSIVAVVLRINSPGGVVGASQEIYDEVKKYRKKHIIVSMGNVAASGGYYIACPAHTIFANPGTITGSIGVIFQLPNAEKLMKKIGVSHEVVKSGKLKDAGGINRGLTVQERKMLQGVVDDTYNQFLEAVSNGRNISIKKLKPICDGRIFTGRQAKNLGLVDSLGSLEDAITFTAKLCSIKGIPKVIKPKEQVEFSIKNLLFNSIAQIILNVDSKSNKTNSLLFQMK